LPAFVQYGRIDAGRTLALLRPAAATSAVFKGTLGSRVRVRSYNLEIGTGAFSAVLRFTGGKRLTLSTPIGRVAGPSPLQLNGTSPAGTFNLRVSGTGAKTTFVLNVSYVR
jgi:hypothetical protein